MMKLAYRSLFAGLVGAALLTGCAADEAAIAAGAPDVSPMSESGGFGGWTGAGGSGTGTTSGMGGSGAFGMGGSGTTSSMGGSTSVGAGGDPSGSSGSGGFGGGDTGGCETGGTEECPECWDNTCWGGEVDQEWEPEEDWGEGGGGGGAGGDTIAKKKGRQVGKAFLEGAPAECTPTTAEASADGCEHADCTTAKKAAAKKLLDALPANCKQHSNKIKTNKPCKKIDC